MTIVAELMNISPTGMFIKPNLTSIRDSLQLAALLAGDASLHFRLRIVGHPAPHEAKARVAWKSDLGIGLDFLEVSAALGDFIQRLSEAGAGAGAGAGDRVLATVEPDPVIEVR